MFVQVQRLSIKGRRVALHSTARLQPSTDGQLLALNCRHLAWSLCIQCGGAIAQFIDHCSRCDFRWWNICRQQGLASKFDRNVVSWKLSGQRHIKQHFGTASDNCTSWLHVAWAFFWPPAIPEQSSGFSLLQFLLPLSWCQNAVATPHWQWGMWPSLTHQVCQFSGIVPFWGPCETTIDGHLQLDCYCVVLKHLSAKWSPSDIR
mmetsp:Transcript_50486/g.100468  ORF Transcript_50486/g.100468 Transcript_50486/m.100468 type:complete len:204 (-) Transcript_50486:1220-1831(-)